MKNPKVRNTHPPLFFNNLLYSLELSLKPAEDLLHELSFLSKKKSLPEVSRFFLRKFSINDLF